MEAALVDICYRPLRVAWAIHSADKEGLCHIAVQRVAKIRRLKESSDCCDRRPPCVHSRSAQHVMRLG